jgi:hypothetical protein
MPFGSPPEYIGQIFNSACDGLTVYQNTSGDTCYATSLFICIIDVLCFLFQVMLLYTVNTVSILYRR